MVAALKLSPPQAKRRGRAPRKSPAEKLASFDIPAALARADEILAGPCTGSLPRVEGRGELVHRFVIPLELAQAENRHSHGVSWSHAARKEKLFRIMWLQHPFVRVAPLPGRPFLRRVRFSVKEADEPGEGFKTPIDFLCVPKPPKRLGARGKKGLGFLVDDAPKDVERAPAWCERVPPGFGFCLLEVWTG